MLQGHKAAFSKDEAIAVVNALDSSAGATSQIAEDSIFLEDARQTSGHRGLEVGRLHRQAWRMSNPSAKTAQAIFVAIISFLMGTCYVHGSLAATIVTGIALLAALYLLIKDFGADPQQTHAGAPMT